MMIMNKNLENYDDLIGSIIFFLGFLIRQPIYNKVVIDHQSDDKEAVKSLENRKKASSGRANHRFLTV